MNQKPVILTGLRANNDLHIGNYLGALLPFIDMAKKHAGEFKLNLFVPDLHSITTPIDHSKLQEGVMRNLKVFVAAGLPLDNDDIRIYRQSYIPAHSELAWILDCFTLFGELRRMRDFKEKAGLVLGQNNQLPDMAKLKQLRNSLTHKEIEPEEVVDALYAALELSFRYVERSETFRIGNRRAEEAVTVGLFNYPALMAADILLYGATYVPVGEDQDQHLEYTRNIAQRINNRFGDIFVVPKPVHEQNAFFDKDQGLRIKDLLDPTKKMSKSDETGKGVIFLSDSPDVAAKKIMSATTDSLNSLKNLDPKSQPGVHNLVTIMGLLDKYKRDTAPMDNTQGYAYLKRAVAERVNDFLEDFQSKLASVDEAAILAKLEKDEEAMRDQSNAVLLKVQRAVGLRPKE